MANYQRQTAHKIWISDLINGDYVRQQGEWEPNYVSTKNLKISRINLVASVIDKYVSDTGDYGYIEVDDSSGAIRIKVWKEDTKLIENINVGDLILIIGKPRETNSELYVIGEIIKKIDNEEWANVRKEELKKLYGEGTRVEDMRMDKKKDEVPEESLSQETTSTNRQKVLSIIEKNDEISTDELSKEIGLEEKEIEKIIKELLREGEIYQPRVGVLKVV